MRLAPEATSDELTGFAHNAVTPIGMKTVIPVNLFLCTFSWMSSHRPTGCPVPVYINDNTYIHDNTIYYTFVPSITTCNEFAETRTSKSKSFYSTICVVALFHVLNMKCNSAPIVVICTLTSNDLGASKCKYQMQMYCMKCAQHF